jgi:hypothetical protein
LKWISTLVAISALLTVSGCSLFESRGEEVNQQPRKAIFRSAEPAEADNPAATPIPKKIPGE